MARTINPIIAIVAVVSILFLVLRSGKTKDSAVHAYSAVTDTVQDQLHNNYLLYFEPTAEPKSTEEAEKLKKQLDEAVQEYRNYLEKDLGSKVKHTYDTTLHGLSVQVEETQELFKALGQKAVGKANKQQTILADKLYELFYKLKGDDLKRLGIKVKLEKDKLMSSS